MNSVDVGLLVLRLVVGVTIGVHGTQKLFGWWGGPGLAKVRQGFAAQRYRPVDLWVALVVLGEVGGALSLIFGFLTPLGTAGVFGAMFMATFKGHWKNGYLLAKGGYEYSLLLMVVSIALGLIGPGSYSLDALFGVGLSHAAVFGALAVAALLVDAIGIYISRPAPPAPAEARSSAS